MPFDRRSWITLALLALSAAPLLGALGARGLMPYVALWTLALVWILPRLRARLVAELPGALFLFLTAAYADNVDDLLGVERGVSLLLVLASLAYLVWRRADVRPLWRSPIVILLIVFYAQQIASAYGFGAESALNVVTNRISLVAAMLVGAVIVRRSDEGRQLVLWLVILAPLLSVPIMLYEVAHPDVRFFTFSSQDNLSRAGGLYGQANGAGLAFDLAIAALLALVVRNEVPRRTALCLGAAFLVGLVSCASRGALFIALLLLATYGGALAWRRAGRAPVATGLIVVGLAVFAVPTLARGIIAADQRLEAAGFEGVDRLNELVLALSGSTTELEEDDSGHLSAATASLQLSAARPWLGFGTDNFLVQHGSREIGSHVEFLQVLGENGLVGLAVYCAFLVAVGLALARAQPQLRIGAGLLVGAWLVMHFESHNLHTARFTMVPLAYLIGLPDRRRGS